LFTVEKNHQFPSFPNAIVGIVIAGISDRGQAETRQTPDFQIEERAMCTSSPHRDGYYSGEAYIPTPLLLFSKLY
jgi:hypothetical protein